MATKTRLQVAVDLMGQGRFAEAKARLVKELRLDTQSAPAVELLGAVLFEMGSLTEAVDCLRRAVKLAPSAPGPQLNLGKALLGAGRFEEASATLAEAVRRWPNIAEGRHSYGNALFAQGEYKRAVEELRAAIALAPGNPVTYASLAFALNEAREHRAVCEVCDQLLKLEPASGVAMYLLAKSRQGLCDWDGFDTLSARFAAVAEQGHVERGMAMTSMLISDDAALHRRCAELTARCYTGGKKFPAPPRLTLRKAGRPRIAYISADFRQHPVAQLIAAPIEAHDRDRFEIIGVSLNPDDGSPERQRLVRGFERFVDVHATRGEATLRLLRELQIDIAVDLMGYTHNCRPTLFMHRIAPIQVSYLGFPGTTGMAAMDYLIADPFVAAGDLARTASEKLVLLPDCFLPADGVAATLPASPSRSDCGLPEDAFVLCSFNHRRKLTPGAFDSWMRILRQVERGVLWLSAPPEDVGQTLRREAERRGVDASRLIFAPRVPSYAEHLARNAVPDLHLDTFPYNAHTTAVDALQAGCPILTRAGTSFAARVCGSLLTALGVPELITDSADAFEAMAVRLTRDKAMMTGLRERVENGRLRSAVFDPARLCRNIERAYAAMLELGRAGKPPAVIDVREVTGALP